MKVYFVDEKGRKSAPSWGYIATPTKLKKLEGLINTEWKDRKEAAQLRTALAILQSTPLVSSSIVGGCGQMSKDTQSTVQPVHALVTAANFNSALQSNQLHSTHADVEKSLARGLDTIQAMNTLNKMWDRTHNNGENPLFGLYGVARHKFLQKGIAKGDIRLEEFVPRNDFASTESFALFACIQTPQGLQEGYLNTPGNLVPLSQAKLYDSLLSAQSAMDRSYSVRRFEEVQIVRLNLTVSGMEDLLKSSNPSARLSSRLKDSCIHTVAADVQRQNIETALQEASDEQLRRQWEERSQAPASPLKRKM